MVSREMMHDAHILDQATEVARRKHQIELVFSIALFDYTELAINIGRSEEHTSELQSLMRISYAVFCLKKKNNKTADKTTPLLSLMTTTYEKLLVKKTTNIMLTNQ